MSERTSEWPSTNVPILGLSEPLCSGNSSDVDDNLSSGDTERLVIIVQLDYQYFWCLMGGREIDCCSLQMSVSRAKIAAITLAKTSV